MKLTYNDLQDIVRECVYRIYTKLPLYEYAVRRSEFVYRVSSLLPQIIENWCLIRYCTLTGRERTKEHWKTELNAHMSNIGYLSVKGNNKAEKRVKAIYEAFDERDFVGDCSERIFLYIENKFTNEKINLSDGIVKQVAKECSEALDDIANAMAEPTLIKGYIETI